MEQIATEILSVSKKGARKTKIMYSANLSFAQLNKYLNLLIDRRLLEELENPERLYRTTDRGKRFLESYKITRYLLGP